MEHLKLFEFFLFKKKTKRERPNPIDEICRRFHISNYTINADGSIDVNGTVNLDSYNLTRLPLNFRNVTGSFYCSDNELRTLEGAPKSVGNDFYCDNNRLRTLEGAPESVGDEFCCNRNRLTSLEGGPKSVGSSYLCRYNRLETLLGAPESISIFDCSDNLIRSFEGIPKNIVFFNCTGNTIYNIWELFKDVNKIDIFNEYDIIRGYDVIIDRLNDFLMDIGEEVVEYVDGYNNIY